MKKKYIYHLSHDTNHDNVIAAEILQTIIADHQEIIEILRADNYRNTRNINPDMF